MKSLVTDGQLAKLAVRQNDLFQRAKKGVYVDFDQMLLALQMVIEGKMPEEHMVTLNPRFPEWRTFDVNGESIHTILLKPSEMGLKSPPKVYTLLDSLFLSQWSRLNAATLPKDYVVELVPLDATQSIRDQYIDQRRDETIRIAMKPVYRQYGGLHILELGWDENDKPTLGKSEIGSRGVWPLNKCILFRLRNVA